MIAMESDHLIRHALGQTNSNIESCPLMGEEINADYDSIWALSGKAKNGPRADRLFQTVDR